MGRMGREVGLILYPKGLLSLITENRYIQTDLEKLIANMEPIFNEGDYVFASVIHLDAIPRIIKIYEIKEMVGITVVLSKKETDRPEISYEFIAAQITLNIYSSLDAIGLIASVSEGLRGNDISGNVIAIYYHDHIFENEKDKTKAINALQNKKK